MSLTALVLAILLAGSAQTAEQVFAADNVSDATVAPGWVYVVPIPRFSPSSPAQRLKRPPTLIGSQLGFFTDPAMIAQYSSRQLSAMQHDRASFVMVYDLDGDGRSETYRTGFWKKPDYSEGTFLAVFDRGTVQVIDTSGGPADGNFLVRGANGLSVSGCNCSAIGVVRYRRHRLSVTWSN